MDSAQSDVDNVLKVASALREFNTLRQEGIVSEQEFLEMKAKLLAVGKDELGRSPSGDTLETLVEATNEMDSSRGVAHFSFADDGGGDLVSNQKNWTRRTTTRWTTPSRSSKGTWQEIKDALGVPSRRASRRDPLQAHLSDRAASVGAVFFQGLRRRQHCVTSSSRIKCCGSTPLKSSAPSTRPSRHVEKVG